jgi:hypothetical protein
MELLVWPSAFHQQYNSLSYHFENPHIYKVLGPEAYVQAAL